MDGPTVFLDQLLTASAVRHPDKVAVCDPARGAQLTYAGLDELSDHVRDHLSAFGVRRGDRVGICFPKSIPSLVAIFGILKTGAAYVPLDAHAPTSRNAGILDDCAVSAVIGFDSLLAALARDENGPHPFPPTICLGPSGSVEPFTAAVPTPHKASRAAPHISSPDVRSIEDLAYVLYTSGSTGRPKGVMLSHRAAMSFVDWATETFDPAPADRFSSHAPFHFDLSIFDIYVPIKHGATLVIIDEQTGKEPTRLARLIADQKITVWYSAPSILSLMVQFGNLPDLDLEALRLVLFAGEVFPVKYLRALRKLLPSPRLFNLYGPTETNVCTFLEIPRHIPEDRTEPYPIGHTCSNAESRVVDAQGEDVAPGEEGELCIRGATVMHGYWNQPERTEAAFFTDHAGRRWYRTGDLVRETESGFLFLGRRDRMIKKRGYRIELGEIEACLYRHPDVGQAAVIAMDGAEGIQVKAYVCPRDGARLSQILLKRFCADHLPSYMVPDRFQFIDHLPTTSTDKVDYQRLVEQGVP